MPMSVRPRALAALGLLALASAGCTSIRDHQGYVVDEALIGTIQPGVDNRESVQGTLGRPSFVGQFDQRDWYYVSRLTKQLAFARPQPTQQTVLHVRFNDAGTVESVQRTGLELARAVEPMGGRTPTLGSNRSFFEEIFGNIGAVGGRGTGGQTADNPQ
ncbi:MAG: outer membrane protein assembly factor BamE [Allosphingosinicella sp.]|uniref:outer membrane protein assembly factor BamE n=1 Tax=Allosphingosinicella sp. TaxID=2823234 RepID=UPI0039289767